MGATDKNEVDHVLKVIKTAWRNGRPIVPIIGAGCSVDSGMPVVQGIERYLAQLYLALKHGVYTGLPTPESGQPFAKLVEYYHHHPDQFVSDHQWPDRFVLHQQLCESQLWNDEKTPDEMSNLVKRAFREIISPSVIWAKELLPPKVFDDGYKLNKLFGNWRGLIEKFTAFNNDLGDALIQRLHERRRPGPCHRYLAFLARLNLWQTFLTFNFDRFIERALNEQRLPHRVFAMEHGDTFPHDLLIHHGLSIVKMHGDTHRLLMDHRLDCPLSSEYLSRLQQCLKNAGSNSGEPALLLVLGCGGTEERCLSILRHHCDEGLRAEDNRVRAIWVHFEDHVPDLLSRCLPAETQKKIQALPSESLVDSKDADNECAKRFSKELRKALTLCGIATVRARNPGLFLMSLYSYLTSRHPASRIPYLSHVDRPIGLQSFGASGSDSDSTRENVYEESKDRDFNKAPVKVFDGRDLDFRDYLHPTASQRLAEYVNQLTSDMYPIWIDLEDCYSVVDVVGRIVEQVRRYDTALAPGVFALDEVPKSALTKLVHQELDPRVIQKAVDRVVRILRRGTYCLAFDALEAISWPPTAHHGDVPNSHKFSESHRIDLLMFLERLYEARGSFRGSQIAMAIDRPKARFPEKALKTRELQRANQVWKQKLDRLRKQLGDFWRMIDSRPPGSVCMYRRTGLPVPLPRVSVRRQDLSLLISLPDGVDVMDDLHRFSLILFRLCAARRTRQLVALRRLLVGLVREEAEVDQVLVPVAAEGILLRVEGGGFWINRPFRDAYYAKATECASPQLLRRMLTGDYTGDKIQRVSAQLWLTFAEHDRWADWSYDHHYLPSKDPHAFFEYVYHRATSIRAITVLLALAIQDPRPVSKSIDSVCRRVSELTPRPEETWFLPSVQHISASPDLIIDELAKLRLARVRWIKAVWEDEGDDLAITTGAERIILWIRWLLVEDLPKFQYPTGSAKYKWKIATHSLSHTNIELKNLRTNLLTLWYRLALNRMDYNAAAKIAAMIDRKAVASVNQAKAVGAAAVFQSADGRLDEQLLETSIDELKRLGHIDDGNPTSELSHPDQLDARVWYLHLWLDAEQYHCTTSNRSPSEKHLMFRKLEVLRNRTIEGLQTSRTLMDIKDEEYRKQHVWLLIQKARIQILQCQDDDAPLEDAYRALEAARTLSNEDPLHRRGIVELYAAHVALAHAELWYLKPNSNADVKSTLRARALSKLSSADAALTRAYEYLRDGRRNTRWWRFYFEILARLAIWQLWSRTSPTFDDESKDQVLLVEQDIAKTLVILRRGFSAIRRQTDLQPQPILTLADLKFKSPYTYSTWEALVRLGTQAVRERTCRMDGAERYRDLFPTQLTWYTMSVGFRIDDDSDNLLRDLKDELREARSPATADLLTVLADTRRHVLTMPHFRRK